jgi:hypothetical protein
MFPKSFFLSLTYFIVSILAEFVLRFEGSIVLPLLADLLFHSWKVQGRRKGRHNAVAAAYD